MSVGFAEFSFLLLSCFFFGHASKVNFSFVAVGVCKKGNRISKQRVHGFRFHCMHVWRDQAAYTLSRGKRVCTARADGEYGFIWHSF